MNNALSFIFLNYDIKRKLVQVYELERAQKWIHSVTEWEYLCDVLTFVCIIA